MDSDPITQKDFRWFFTGQTVSLLGSSMAPVALAFAVLDASGSTSQLGVVLVARMVPLLAFLLVGGATADRFSRWTVLVFANLGSALTQGAVATLLLTGHYSLFGVAVLELFNGFVLSARGVGLLVMGAIGALPLIALGAHQHAPWLIAAAFIGGLGSSALGISWDTSLQEHVPANALSRVSSYDNLLSYLSIPIGQLCVSPLAHAFGGFRVALIAGVLYVLYTVAAVAPWPPPPSVGCPTPQPTAVEHAQTPAPGTAVPTTPRRNVS